MPVMPPTNYIDFGSIISNSAVNGEKGWIMARLLGQRRGIGSSDGPLALAETDSVIFDRCQLPNLA